MSTNITINLKRRIDGAVRSDDPQGTGGTSPLGFTYFPNREPGGLVNGQVAYELSGSLTPGSGNLIDPNAIAEHARMDYTITQGFVGLPAQVQTHYEAFRDMHAINPSCVKAIYRAPNEYRKAGDTGSGTAADISASIINDPRANDDWKLKDDQGVQVEAVFSPTTLWRINVYGGVPASGFSGSGDWLGLYLAEVFNDRYEALLNDDATGGQYSLFDEEVVGQVAIYQDVEDLVTQVSSQNNGNDTTLADWDRNGIGDSREGDGSRFHQQGRIAMLDDWQARRPCAYSGNAGTDGNQQNIGALPINATVQDDEYWQKYDGRLNEYQGTQTGIRPRVGDRSILEVRDRNALRNGFFWQFNGFSKFASVKDDAAAYGGFGWAAPWYDLPVDGSPYPTAPIDDQYFELVLLNFVCCWLHHGLVTCPSNDGTRRFPLHFDPACIALGRPINSNPLPSMGDFDNQGNFTLRPIDQGGQGLNDDKIYMYETDRVVFWVNAGQLPANGTEYLSWSTGFDVVMPQNNLTFPAGVSYQNLLPNCGHLGMRSQNTSIFNGAAVGSTHFTKRGQARVALKPGAQLPIPQ